MSPCLNGIRGWSAKSICVGSSPTGDSFTKENNNGKAYKEISK